MKSLRLIPLLAVVLAFGYTSLRAVEQEPKKEGTEGKCCVKAAKEGKTCDHPCCVESAKEGKNCEKCGGTNAPKK